MNSWKFNSIAQTVLRKAVARYFEIEYSDVYKKVTYIDRDFIYKTERKTHKSLVCGM